MRIKQRKNNNNFLFCEYFMINKRIMELINAISKGNKRAFSHLVGVTPTVIENIVGTRQGKPGYELMSKIAFAIENINLDWLLTGRGTMFLNDLNQPLSPQHPSLEQSESSFIYKMYQDEKAEKERMLRDKDAKIEELNQRIIALSTELTEARLEGLPTAKNASTKKCLSRKTRSVDSDNVNSQKP
ncbi:hypothetical protein ACIXCY_22150 [Bacteroides fragilis]